MDLLFNLLALPPLLQQLLPVALARHLQVALQVALLQRDLHLLLLQANLLLMPILHSLLDQLLDVFLLFLPLLLAL